MEQWNDLPIKERKAGRDIYRAYPYFAWFFHRNRKKPEAGLGGGGASAQTNGSSFQIDQAKFDRRADQIG